MTALKRTLARYRSLPKVWQGAPFCEADAFWFAMFVGGAIAGGLVPVLVR